MAMSSLFHIIYLCIIFVYGCLLIYRRDDEGYFLSSILIFMIPIHIMKIWFPLAINEYPFTVIFVFLTIFQSYLEIRYFTFVFFHDKSYYVALKYGLRIFSLILIIISFIFYQNRMILEYVYYAILSGYTPLAIIGLLLSIRLILKIQLIGADNLTIDLKLPQYISVGLFLNLISTFFYITNLLYVAVVLRLVGYTIIIVCYYFLKKDNLRDILEFLSRKEQDLRESENLYRNFVKNSHGIFYQMTEDFNFIFIHGETEKIIGYEAQEFYRGDINYIDLIDTDIRKIYIENLEDIIANKKSRLEMEYQIKHKSGKLIWVFNHIERLFDPSDELVYLQGVIFDVSNRKETEMELIRQQQQLERENFKNQKLESLALLAGGIAHDFNNILVAILGNIELLQMDVLDKTEKQDLMQDLKEGTLRASNLTKQLLTFSKGGAPIKNPESISTLVEESTRFVMAGSNSTYRLHLTSDLPPANVDAGQISQVLNNLIINAQQAMPQGGIIEITTELVKDFGQSYNLPVKDYILLKIKDEGSGIPTKHYNKIFTPYFSTKAEGNGLGLATTYSIINRHGGMITFDSELNQGTTFYIYLPVAENTTHRESTLQDCTNIPTEQKVLIMDDDQAVHRTLERMLRHLEFDVYCVNNGKEALEEYQKCLDSNPFDLIVMDLTISGAMGGKETIKCLREIDPHVNAIVSSGYSNDPIMADYKNYGFKAVLRKPYTFEQLKKVLAEIYIQ